MWVLLIEDDKGTAKSVELMLKAKDHTCDIRQLGEDGLAAAGLYAYDVILLDARLRCRRPRQRPSPTQNWTRRTRRMPT